MGFSTSNIFWSHQCCCTSEDASVHGTHNTTARSCYTFFCASSMQCMSCCSPSSAPSPLYPWPCRGGQTAAGSSLYRVHAEDKPTAISEARDDQRKPSALQWVWVFPTSLAIPSRENRRTISREGSLQDGLCTRSVPCSSCLYAAARWPFGSPTA